VCRARGFLKVSESHLLFHQQGGHTRHHPNGRRHGKASGGCLFELLTLAFFFGFNGSQVQLLGNPRVGLIPQYGFAPGLYAFAKQSVRASRKKTVIRSLARNIASIVGWLRTLASS